MTPPRAIAADLLILPTTILEGPLVLLDGDVVTRITTQDSTEAPQNTLRLDGCTLAAGFLDVHVHGAGGCDVMDGSEATHRVGAVLARHGTTSFLATTVTSGVERTLRSLDGMATAIEGPAPDGAARAIGIHLEGPFLSHAKRGVHPPSQLQPPSIDLFDRFWEAARGQIRLITIAPELPGAPELIAHATSLGVRVSLGHSNALAAEARCGIAAGAVSATHTFNAMRPLDHREPGILGVVLDDDALYAELICDGVHTTPEAVRLWLRCKGTERAMLVTDGMAAMGMPDGQYRLGDLEVDVRNGTCTSDGVLAGSVLTLECAVSNLQRFTGTPLATAVRLAGRNQARMLGLASADALEGYKADFTIFDAQGGFQGSIVRGTPLG